MTVLLKYLRSTVQFKNRLLARGIITGVPTLLLFFSLGQNRFPEKHHLNEDHVRNTGLGPLSCLVGYLVGRASIHQPLGTWKSLLSGVYTHNSWIQHLPRMATATLRPNSTVLDQGQGQANWKAVSPVCPVSLADWEKPISLDSWPGHIISCFQQNPMGKLCTNPKGIISMK